MATMTAGSDEVARATLAKRGAIAAVVAATVNVLLAMLARGVLDIPEAFVPLGAARVAVLTIGGAVLATVVYAVVHRASETPDRTFLTVALIALVVSFVPDILLLVNPSVFPGITALGVSVLMLLHVVAAAIIVPVLAPSLWRTG